MARREYWVDKHANKREHEWMKMSKWRVNMRVNILWSDYLEASDVISEFKVTDWIWDAVVAQFVRIISFKFVDYITDRATGCTLRQ